MLNWPVLILVIFFAKKVIIIINIKKNYVTNI